MELPCLALHGYSDRSTELFSVPGQKRITVAGDGGELLPLRNKAICPTARGLLLVRDPATLATFLWSPRDGAQVHLPPLEGLDDEVLACSHCLLSDEPSAAGCVVLLVQGGDDTVLWYCRPGDDSWTRHDYDIGTQVLPYPDGDRYEKTTICPVAACRGKFYFNGSPTELGVLEFSPDPVFSFIAVDDDGSSQSYEPGDAQEEAEDVDDDEGLIEGQVYTDDEEYTDNNAEYDESLIEGQVYTDDVYTDNAEYDEDNEDYEGGSPAVAVFLVESGGDLYKVSLLYVTPWGDEIHDGFVDRFDFSERRWRGVDDLGGRTFLLSLFHFGASCSGGDQGFQRDCVYIVYPWKKEMQVFNVKEETNYVHKLDEAPTADKAFWLLPADT